MLLTHRLNGILRIFFFLENRARVRSPFFENLPLMYYNKCEKMAWLMVASFNSKFDKCYEKTSHKPHMSKMGYKTRSRVCIEKKEVDFTFSLYLIKIFSVLLDHFQRQRIRDAEASSAQWGRSLGGVQKLRWQIFDLFWPVTPEQLTVLLCKRKLHWQFFCHLWPLPLKTVLLYKTYTI